MEEPYSRTSGDVECETCGEPYHKHPIEKHYDAFDGQEMYLTRDCQGRLLKL